MNKQISPAELSKGMFVTVLKNEPYKTYKESIFGGVQTILNEDRGGMGKVLVVEAIELPYVIVRYEDRVGPFTYEIDTRRTTLMELCEDYVFALHPHLKKSQ